ncbi:MAG: type IV secretion system protein VirD4, partial [Thermus sp.]|nr:type IV secretion system protein VirD4 [Thermus sp.]
SLPTPWAANPGGVDSLVLYLEALTQHLPVFKRYYSGRETTRLDILLPEGFPLPEPAWAKQGWCEVGENPLRLELTKRGLEVLEKEARASYRALIRWCRVVERWHKENQGPLPDVIQLPKDKAKEVLLDKLCGSAVEVEGEIARIRPGLGLAGFRCPRPEPHGTQGVHAAGGGGDSEGGHGGSVGADEPHGPETPGGSPAGGQGGEGSEGVPAHHL